MDVLPAAAPPSAAGAGQVGVVTVEGCTVDVGDGVALEEAVEATWPGHDSAVGTGGGQGVELPLQCGQRGFCSWLFFAFEGSSSFRFFFSWLDNFMCFGSFWGSKSCFSRF